jgi:hypothetical protein
MTKVLLCLSCLHKTARRMTIDVPMPLPDNTTYVSRRSVRRCERCGAEWENTQDGDWRPAYFAAIKEAKP